MNWRPAVSETVCAYGDVILIGDMVRYDSEDGWTHQECHERQASVGPPARRRS